MFILKYLYYNDIIYTYKERALSGSFVYLTFIFIYTGDGIYN